ncbi:hypothetical protein ACFTSF_25265 [Kribbella sp. NPDC056951]|uniref:hypothetical protein n=1 Tax=Kribbella sp. NPDC056951 TaxID=3345978 RepID=UPI003626A594
MKRVLVRAVAATTLGAAALGGVSVAANAATDSVQACTISVAPPDSQVRGYVWVTGGRRGCTNTVRLTTELYRGYWGVDPVKASKSDTGVNFDVTAKTTCSEAGNHGEFYGKTKGSDGGSRQGPKNDEC